MIIKKIVKTLSLFISTILIVCCTSTPPKENSKKKEIINLGGVLPLTGDIASYGINSKNGLELALSMINKDTSKKYTIKVNYQDSKGQAKDAVSIMQKFCSVDKYPVVVGEAASSVSLAMVGVANQYKTLQISSVSSSPELSKNDFFFRVCPSDAFQAGIMAKWVQADGIKKIAIIYINNSWGSSLKEEFIKNYVNDEFKITLSEAVNEGQKDFRTLISKILQSGAQAIYSPTHGKEGGIILKQLKEMGNKLPIYGADVWSSPELLETAGNAAEEVKIVKPDKFNNPLYNSFQKKYVAVYKKEPDVYAAYAYDIAFILSEALEKGNKTGESIKKYLSSMPVYQGVTGETSFDSNGDCNTKPFIRQIIKNGKYTTNQ